MKAQRVRRFRCSHTELPNPFNETTGTKICQLIRQERALNIFLTLTIDAE